MKTYCVYIVANMRNGTTYIGATNNLLRRMIEHKRKLVKGFSQKHDLKMLVWYEQTESIKFAIKREKEVKRWRRKWKLESHLVIPDRLPE